jgi:phytanoyl-CoA dioxygenase PhyH
MRASDTRSRGPRAAAVADRLRDLLADRRRDDRTATAGPTRSGTTTSAPPPSAANQVDRLVDEGRILDAVDALATAYRTTRDPADAIRLVDLRHEAFATLEARTGRSPWPPTYDDPFPAVSGRLPEVEAPDLTTEVLGGAVAHHGALVVRGLFDDDRVARGLETIQTAQRARDALSDHDRGDEWFRPFPKSERNDNILRRMVRDTGGTWLADSPAAAAHFLDELTAVGAVGVIAEHLGERPCFSLQKSTMRESQPEEQMTGWHQDGSFLEGDVRTMNVWVSFTRCGGEHPAPGLEVIPRRFNEILPTMNLWSPSAISFDLIDELATDTPVIRPAFEPGDALMFDERFVHRTFLDGSMTNVRYALECWFFAPSHYAENYLPLVV